MAYFPEESIVKSRILQPINLLTTGNSLLLSIPPGYIFFTVGSAKLTFVNVAGTGTTACTVSIGNNNSSYNNIYNAITPSLLNIGLRTVITIPELATAYDNSIPDIYLRISGAASGFTTLTGMLYMPYILVKYP